MNRIGRRSLFQNVSAFWLASKMSASATALATGTPANAGKPLQLADF